MGPVLLSPWDLPSWFVIVLSKMLWLSAFNLSRNLSWTAIFHVTTLVVGSWIRVGLPCKGDMSLPWSNIKSPLTAMHSTHLEHQVPFNSLHGIYLLFLFYHVTGGSLWEAVDPWGAVCVCAAQGWFLVLRAVLAMKHLQFILFVGAWIAISSLQRNYPLAWRSWTCQEIQRWSRGEVAAELQVPVLSESWWLVYRLCLWRIPTGFLSLCLEW